jgi:hypothetical protein
MEGRKIVVSLKSSKLVEGGIKADVSGHGDLRWWTREWTEGFKAHVDKWMAEQNLSDAHLFNDRDEDP